MTLFGAGQAVWAGLDELLRRLKTLVIVSIGFILNTNIAQRKIWTNELSTTVIN